MMNTVRVNPTQADLIAAVVGHSATHSQACAIPATWTITGLSAGLPLAAKIRETAPGSVAIPPNP